MEIFWDQLEHDAWERLADTARAPMQQRWTYGEVHHALGGQVHRAVTYVNAQPVAMCQVLSRKIAGVFNLALATRGPVFLTNCNAPQALRLIRRTLPTARPKIPLFTLAAPVKSLRTIPMMTPATFAIRPLPLARDGLHGKWRNALKKAESSEIRVLHNRCSKPALQQLLQLDQSHQISAQYRALPPAFSQSWQDHAPQDLRLFTALEKGHIVASALFIRHGATASYHIAHSSARGRTLSAARLLLWRAFEDLAQAGVTQIDLGIIDTENAAGLARFKLGSGATALRSGPTVLAL